MKHLIACLALLLTICISAQVEGPELPYNPDAQPDGYIGAADVVELLTYYGQPFTPDDVFFNSDSSHVIMHVGDLNYPECEYTCEHGLSGEWKISGLSDLGSIWAEAVANEAWIAGGDLIGFSGTPSAMVRAYASDTPNGTTITDNITSSRGCYCATAAVEDIEEVASICDTIDPEAPQLDTCSVFLNAWTVEDYEAGDVPLFGPSIECCALTGLVIQDTLGAGFRMTLSPGSFWGQKTTLYIDNTVCPEPGSGGPCAYVEIKLYPDYLVPEIYPTTILLYPGNAKEFIWLGDRWRSFSNPF